MTSALQIASNRRNAKKCTGPRTPQGKAISSRNALKTGIDAKSDIILSESRAQLDALTTGYLDHFAPTTPRQRQLVDALINAEWLSRRYLAVETRIWNRNFELTNSDSLGDAFAHSPDHFTRVDRRQNGAHRGYLAALRELDKLQSNSKQRKPLTQLVSSLIKTQ